MKVSTLLAGFTFLAVGSAGEYADYQYIDDEFTYTSEEYDYYESETFGWNVPTATGDFYWFSKDDWTKSIQPYSIASAAFYLYTNLNPDESTRLYPDDVDSIISSNFNISNPTRFLIHGYLNNAKSDFCVVVRKALIAAEECNVIVVDWNSMSSAIYHSARNTVSDAGMKVAVFIDFLNSKIGMPFEDLTIIGHSLGAHVAGFAGKLVENGKVDVIIGLDPAGPLFDYSDTKNRLHKTDANFVQTIQTSTLYGFREPIGEVAFFPNGGEVQPGCTFDFTGTCSHARAFYFYAESVILDNFASIKCKTRKAALAKCGKTVDDVKMGSANSYGAKGIYYVPVNKKSPYGTL